MGATADLLDLAKKRRGIPTDMALGERLGKSRQTISQWRSGTRHPEDDQVLDLVRLAEVEPGPWLVAVQAERSTGAAGKAWADLAKRLAAAAACLLLAAGVTLPNEARAAEFAGLSASRDATGLYIMRYWRKWLRALFSRDFRWMPVPA